ncbi:MAG TPA: type II toxin-antitoxin system RelE/ParE family toxin [Terriglobales bacterium]|nr:type II toxin-antitoxin system RelE/ParE family toxin [Terriglobales bacterium]
MASTNSGWRIEINRTAERQIKKLGRSVQRTIIRFLKERLILLDNPRQLGKPLRGEKGELWRYRVGDYRLVCDIRDEKLTVLLVQVGHRKEVYR